MMTRLVEIYRKNPILGFWVKIFVKCAMFCINCWYEICGVIRVMFNFPSKYDKLKELKGMYKGKRCFVICTGPSLTEEDLEKIKNEYTFGMNSLCLMADKTSFRPNFYGCCDLGVYKKLKHDMIKYCENCDAVFVSDRLKRHEVVPDGWILFSHNVAYNSYARWFKNDFSCKFSEDCYRVVYSMFSITHCLIQIAIYMGFTEIYLLGADCSFPKGKQIHFEDYGVLDSTIDTARERNIAGYEEVKRYTETHDVKIFNATRGGSLEVFERVDLDSVLTND